MVREHPELAVVLALAVLLRLGVAVAYRPALLDIDSLQYLDIAEGGPIVGFEPDHPSGYPFLIKLLSITGHRNGAVVLAQHLAGLVTGVLTYALLLRLRVPRWVGAVAAALFLLDGYMLTLEQEIMTEAFFALALMGSAYLAVGKERGPVSLATSGALLAATATMRTAALFAIPVWGAYVLWTHRGSRTAAAAAVGLILPLLVYAAANEHRTGRFAIGGPTGWFMYGRVGAMADCEGIDVAPEARPLCERTAEDEHGDVLYYMWSPRSPARREFGGMWVGPPEQQERSNRILKDFSYAVIRHRPGEYVGAVAGDFLRFFRPGVKSSGGTDFSINLPPPGPRLPLEDLPERVRPVYLPSVHFPWEAVRTYQRYIHTPRWLLAGFALALVLALSWFVATRGRVRLPHLPEALFLGGCGLAILLGSTATSDFILRYLVPLVPLLVCGGVLATLDLVAAVRAATVRR